MAPRKDTVTIENARLIYKNFSGIEGMYNRAGEMSFAILLEEALAERLLGEGWNVKFTKPRKNDGEEDYEPQPYLEVAVNFDGQRAARVTLLTDITKKREALGPETVGILDSADITNVDLVLNPYHWTVRADSGVKAYLKTMFVTIAEDELDVKYANK